MGLNSGMMKMNSRQPQAAGVLIPSAKAPPNLERYRPSLLTFKGTIDYFIHEHLQLSDAGGILPYLAGLDAWNRGRLRPASS